MEARKPAKPRERLASLRDPRASRLQRQRKPRPPPAVYCPDCSSTDLVEVDGGQACAECGRLINDTNIVSEVTFGESSNGAAVVQGGFVGEGQRHARTMGPGGRRYGGMDAKEVTESFGRDEIRRLGETLNLSQDTRDQAFQVYKLAAGNHFTTGRRLNVVAAACLYIACRRMRNGRSTSDILMIDLAEPIKVSVYRLGQTYSDLRKCLAMDKDFDVDAISPYIEVQNLIMKFCRRLEFGNQTQKIANDAARLVGRMKRDWIVTGRSPAGLCGACIILAARMNNYRRSVREVVYVVKVAEMTVHFRLHEFKRTVASGLTVDQFRDFGTRLKKQADPPALYKRRERDEKEKKRKAAQVAASDGTGSVSSRASSLQPLVSQKEQQHRRDADGFAIPDIPIDPRVSRDDRSDSQTLETGLDDHDSEPPKKRRRGRPKKSEQEPSPFADIRPEDIMDPEEERELEQEMEGFINDPETLHEVGKAKMEELEERSKELARRLREEALNETHNHPDTTEIGEDEFDDDPEIRNCLLSEAESRLKERIWVTHNEDWLRAQQSKMLKLALEEASGEPKKVKKTRVGRKGKNAAGGDLQDETPAGSPSEANMRMLQKRNASKHVNYAKLKDLYDFLDKDTESDVTSDAASRASSTAPAGSVDRADRGSVSPLPVSSRFVQLPTPATTQEDQTKAQEEQIQKDANQRADGPPDEEEVEEEDMEEEEALEVLAEEYGNEGGYDDDEEIGFEDEPEDY